MKNNCFTGILLVCDMDGTLLNSQHRISAQNKQALEHFVAHGGLFTVATGRIETSMAPYLEHLPINVPAILYNGGMVYDFATGQVVWNGLLPRQTSEIIAKVLKNFPGIGVEIYQNGQVYLLAENALTDRHLMKEKIPFLRASSLTKIPEPWQKVLLAWDPPQIQPVEDLLEEEDLPLVFVRSEPYFLEILPPNVNKGSALTFLTQYLGIPCSRVVAMGDNPNDQEMLEIASIGVAVGNAHSALKTIATFSSVYNDQHAVAEVVDWIEHKMPK